MLRTDREVSEFLSLGCSNSVEYNAFLLPSDIPDDLQQLNLQGINKVLVRLDVSSLRVLSILGVIQISFSRAVI